MNTAARTIATASGLILAAVITAGAVQTTRTIERSLARQSCLTEQQRNPYTAAQSHNICAGRLN